MLEEKINLSIVVPCYNEEGNITLFYETTIKALDQLMNNTEIIFVNDGSTDNTIQEMKEIYEQSQYRIKIINFSRNFGKEAAMLAGLRKAEGKYTAIIDADLQQNPKYIIEMKKILDENEEYDAVAAYQEKRKENKIVSLMKKTFYKLMNKITEVDIPESASDFRLLRRCVVDAILQLPEKTRFSKGIFAWIGFNTYVMPYKVEERANGVSKWGVKKLFNYALDGITDFSVKPLMLSMSLGIFLAFTSVIATIVLLIVKVIGEVHISNFILLCLFIVFVLSIQLISNAIIGKYIAKSYIEIKDRPLYIVKEEKDNERKDKIYLQ